MVGVPIQEARLTALVSAGPEQVLSRSGTGTTVVLEEVELGVGRPDLVVLRLDLATAGLRRSAGLRLHNLAEARALGVALEGDGDLSSVSAEHTARLVRRLEAKGWLGASVLSRVVSESVLIEAKISHWGLGVQQLARVRWASNHAALLVPSSTALRVPGLMLDKNDLGLLAEVDGRLVWELRPPRRELPLHLDAWLGELALRRLDCA